MVSGRRVYGPTRRDPIAAHKDAIALRAHDSATPHVVVTLQEAADAMHAELAGLRRPGTVEFYRQQAKAVFRWLDSGQPVHRLKAVELQDLVRRAQAGRFSARTIQHYRRWLNRLIRWCADPQRGWFRGENPVERVTWPSARATRPDVMDEGDLASRLAEMKTAAPADYDLVLFLAFSGLRRSELARLHCRDFDLKANVVLVHGKTATEPVPITEAIAAAAKGLLARAEGGWIVSGHTEKRRVQAIDRVFRRWAARFGDRRFHPHTLRHSLATNLIRAGVSTAVVQRMLRHSSYATTQRYVHLVADDLHGAAGRLRYVQGGGQEAAHG